jgi:NAD+ kinase
MEIKVQVPIASRATCFVSFDGQHRTELFKGDSLRICSSAIPVPTVCLEDQSSDWFNALETCLHWNKREVQKSFLKW